MNLALEWDGCSMFSRREGERQRIYIGKIVRHAYGEKGPCAAECWSVYLRGACVAVMNTETSARRQLEALARSREEA